MAVPKLADDLPFYLLDPASLAVPPAEAASREEAARAARKISVAQMRPVDLVICGSVAVNRDGARLGKGAGYSGIEVALLQEAGLIGPNTVIATTVHPLQVISEALPETEHDFSVDLIVTPDEVIECGPPRRPGGLYWEHLTAGKSPPSPSWRRALRPAQGSLVRHETGAVVGPGHLLRLARRAVPRPFLGLHPRQR